MLFKGHAMQLGNHDSFLKCRNILKLCMFNLTSCSNGLCISLRKECYSRLIKGIEKIGQNNMDNESSTSLENSQQVHSGHTDDSPSSTRACNIPTPGLPPYGMRHYFRTWQLCVSASHVSVLSWKAPLVLLFPSSVCIFGHYRSSSLAHPLHTSFGA